MDDNYYLTTNRLVYSHNSHQNIRTTNLNNSVANYINKGIFLNSNINNSTSYDNGILVNKITKAISNNNGVDIPNNITSNKIVYVINKVNIQNDSWNPGLRGTKPTAPTEGNADKTPYFIKRWTEDSIDISSNQVQLKIYNLADATMPVYTIGNENNFSTEVGETIFFDISRNNRIDAYNNPNFDIANRGFWYSEDMQYTISFSLNSITNNLYKPLRYELRSYYNETGFANVSATQTGSTVILENSDNTNNFIYFDNLSSVPSVAKNTTDMIQYTTDNKINGIPNLHLDSGKSFTITLRYLANNYSTRFLLDKTKNVLKHQFSYLDTELYNISWNSHISSAPNIANNGYKRDKSVWDISGIEITSAPNLETATTGITLKIIATNTFGTAADFIINTSALSSVYKFIYDKPTITEFNNIKNSLIEIPASFNPTYNDEDVTSPPIFTNSNAVVYKSFGNGVNSTNDLQMSMWNGFFYSDTGWKKETDISGSNISPHNISTTTPIPVFNGSNDDYKWVIFKYTCNRSYSAAYKIALGFASGDSNVTLSNIINGDVKIFANFNRIDTYTGSGSYYWLNIGQSDGGITPSNASGKAYNYEGKLRFTPSDTTLETNFISGANVRASFLPGVSNSVLHNYKRLIGALFNSINTSTNNNIFIAIGIKNSADFYIKKPHIWLSDGNTNESFEKLE
jgi:hypothetical protein